MTVKEILILCSSLLDNSDIENYLNSLECNDETTAKNDCDLLLRCYNLITDEISREYYLLTTTENFTPIDGVISYEQFTFNPVLIKKVKKIDGSEVNHKIHPVKIFANESVKVEYAYACPERTIDEVSDYSFTKISKRILAYGTACEYCLIKGMFEEGVNFRNKYQSALRGALQVKKSLKLKQRTWY